MRFLITGASGFIGFNLCRKLAAEFGRDNLQLVVPPLDRHHKEAFRRQRLAEDGFELLVQDLCDEKLELAARLKPFDVLVHLAAFAETETDDERASQVNDVGTDRLLEELRPFLAGKWVIYTSSLAAVDRSAPDSTPMTEDYPCHPRTLYGRGKLEAERHLRRHAERSGFNWTVLRLPTVYGALYRPGGMFDEVERGLHSGALSTRIAWPGRIGLLYVEDLVAILFQLVSRGVGKNELFHVSSGQAPVFDELIGSIAEVLGVRRARLTLPQWLWRWLARASWQADRLPLPHRLKSLAWRVSLVVTDGFVGDGRRFESVVFTRFTPLAEGLRKTYAKSR